MIVYQTNHEGVFVGPVELNDSDRDPMSPDEYLIPGGCAIEQPPVVAEEERARWDGDVWLVEAIPALPEQDPPVVTEPARQPTEAEIAAARAALDALVTARVITAEARAAMWPLPLI